MLTPIDTRGLIFHYSFDDATADSPFINTGWFGPHFYSATPHNVQSTSGIFGRAAHFGAVTPSYTKSAEWQPFLLDQPRTLAAWIQTTSPTRNSAIMVGTPQGEYRLTINEGLPEVVDRSNAVRVSSTVPRIDDGDWHHVAVTYAKGATLQESQFYIDGNRVMSDHSGDSSAVRSGSPGLFLVGTYGAGIYGAGGSRDQFTGRLDDVSVRSSALTPLMIRALADAALNRNLHYNAAVMDSLFRLFRLETAGQVTGKNGEHDTNLSGEPGTVSRDSSGHLEVVLNDGSEGVRTDTEDAAVKNPGIRACMRPTRPRIMLNVGRQRPAELSPCSHLRPTALYTITGRRLSIPARLRTSRPRTRS